MRKLKERTFKTKCDDIRVSPQTNLPDPVYLIYKDYPDPGMTFKQALKFIDKQIEELEKARKYITWRALTQQWRR